MSIHDLPTAEVLKLHNELAEQVGKPTLKSWSKSKAVLIERVDALRAELPQSAKPARAKGTKPNDKEGLTGKQLGVKAFIEDRILAGEDDATILAACREHFPAMDWDHRRHYPRWYRNAMDRRALKKAAR